MDDTISRKEALEALRSIYSELAITGEDGNEYISYDKALEAVENVPLARDTGKWLDLPFLGMCECSNCGCVNLATTYCPECGSKNITRCDGDSCPIFYDD